ncbi:hypothetical protein GCM10028791_24770 [Echinicola sediminis]
MKRINLILLGALLFIGQSVFGQESFPPLYTVVYNHAPEHFQYPLIGFVNHGTGSHKGAQIGFVNINTKNFSGVQVGFVNTVGKTMTGLQTGFINIVADSIHGSQIGFINTFVKKSSGVQIGFVNTAAHSLDGSQVGFVNLSPKEVKGAQIGFVNTVKKLSTFQLGFVNYADTLDKGGVPIGFLSIIRQGGYKALEVSYNELFPYSLALKIGVPAFYTSFIGSYNPDYEDEYALGAGFGSILTLGNIFFVNPEASYQHQLHGNNDLTRLNLNFGLNIGENIQLLAGPSATWSRLEKDGEFLESTFYIHRERFDDDNELLVGFNAALRINFSN